MIYVGKDQKITMVKSYLLLTIKLKKGAYQLYSLKPPESSFSVGRCKDLGVRNLPCCEHGKPCQLWNSSIQGSFKIHWLIFIKLNNIIRKDTTYMTFQLYPLRLLA